MTESGARSRADTNYVPALRWKKGEILALKRFLQDPLSARATPLILVDNVKEREQNESGSIPGDPRRYIDYTASEMQKMFNSRRAFVDTCLFDSERAGVDGIAEFFNNGIAKVSMLVPVLRLSDSETRLNRLRDVISGRGVALRLPERRFRANTDIDNFLKALQIDESSVDLIADLEVLEEKRSDIEPIADLIQGLTSRETAWRSVTLLAGAYPSKPEFLDGQWINYPRSDWDVYKNVARCLRARKHHVPWFGDYGIVNPAAKPTSGSGGGGGTRPIIRYCAAGYWRIRRASEITKKGSVSEYFELARQCAIDSAFMGREFSFGDRFIDDRAMGHVMGGGNAASYIAVDTNHHLTYTSVQVSKTLPKPAPRLLNELPTEEQRFGETSFDQYWED